MAIGFIGLGGMGLGMAQNLHKRLRSSLGESLTVWNRSKQKASTLVEDGAHLANSPEDLAACSIVFAMLADDGAVKQVFRQWLSGVAAAAEAGTLQQRVFVDCSTVLPSTTRELAEEARRQGGVSYCVCSVFGRPEVAVAARLAACVAGGTAVERDQISRLAASFAGRGVRDLGSDPSAANSLKLMGNLFIVSQIELAAECLALAAKAGVPEEAALGVMEMIVTPPATGAPSIATGYAQRIAAGQYSSEGGFSVTLGLKDVGHMRQLGREVGCPLPLADLAHQHLLTAESKWGGELDWGVIGLVARDAAGLPPPGAR